eukprot:UN04492
MMLGIAMLRGSIFSLKLMVRKMANGNVLIQLICISYYAAAIYNPRTACIIIEKLSEIMKYSIIIIILKCLKFIV